MRVGRTELENGAIDEFVAGRVSRRDFIRSASVIGLSVPALAAVLEACSTGTNTTTGGNIKKGGRLNVGHQTPAGAMDPILTNDLGRLTILGQCGEYLAFSDKDLHLRPVLATSWTPNADGSYTLYFGAGPQGPIVTTIDATRGNEILKHIGRQQQFAQPQQQPPAARP